MAIAYKVDKAKRQLVITIDIGDQQIRDAPLSKSGKSKVVATTGGFQRVNETTLRYALNVIHEDRLRL